MHVTQMLTFSCIFVFLAPRLEDFRFFPLDAVLGFPDRVFCVFFAISIAKIRYLPHYLLLLRPILVVSVL